MSTTGSVFSVACTDFTSLIEEDLWEHLSKILFSPGLSSVRYLAPLDNRMKPIQSSLLLGYTNQENVDFVFRGKGGLASPHLEISGIPASPRDVLKAIFSLRGVPAADYPHGLLMYILDDVKSRIQAANRFSIAENLSEQIAELDSFRYTLGYDAYIQKLIDRYGQQGFRTTTAKTIFGYFLRSLQVKLS